MKIRVHNTGEHFIDYNNIGSFTFHGKYLFLESDVEDLGYFINSDKMDRFSVEPDGVDDEA